MLDKNIEDRIRDNADYGRHQEGKLSDEEITFMVSQVDTALATTNGDTGPCTITARQLALLLAAVSRDRREAACN